MVLEGFDAWFVWSIAFVGWAYIVYRVGCDLRGREGK